MRIIDPTFPTGGEPTPRFIDTSEFGAVPFRVVAPGDMSPAPVLAVRQAHREGAQDEALHHPLPQARDGRSEAPADAPGGEVRAERASNYDPLDALRVTLEAIEAETAWRGPPRELPLRERAAGASLVARLNAAIATLTPLLDADPPPARKAIRLAPLPTTVLLARGDLRPALHQAERAFRWLEDRRRWVALRATWEAH